MFENLIKNKRIIIVGPSITVQECNLGKFINDFDIIVRLNKSLPIPKKMYPHIGNRTDILYNSLNTIDYPGENNFNPHFLKKNNVIYLRCPYPPISPFTRDIKSFYIKNKNIIDFGHINTNYYMKLENGLGTRPYTGTCAIVDLLKYDIKELFVMGIDFYTYKHSFYYRNVSENKLRKLRNNSIHRRTPQINLLKRFYLLDNRLVVDNILDEILLEKYDSLFYGIKNNIDFETVFITGTGEYITDYINIKNKLCILGPQKDKNKNYKNIHTIIDLFPNKRIKFYKNKDIKYVYKNISEFSENHSDKNIIFTQMYKNSIDDEFKKENYMFINPVFIQYLKKILTKTIFSKGTLSLELFIILVFSIFSKKTFISGVDPNCNWLHQAANEKQHYIEQRMLFQYLLKRNRIKYL